MEDLEKIYNVKYRNIKKCYAKYVIKGKPGLSFTG